MSIPVFYGCTSCKDNYDFDELDTIEREGLQDVKACPECGSTLFRTTEQ